MGLFKMLDLWKATNGAFKKPKLHWKAGKWINDPCLPVWRRGMTIWLGKYGEYTGRWPDKLEWNQQGKQRHPFLSKHFKPLYVLPMWTAFHVFNTPTIWKTKWDDYRFEYEGHFTAVVFGLSFSVWTSPPVKVDAPWGQAEYDHDGYWESILWFIDEKRNGLSDIEALKKASNKVGFATSTRDGKSMWCLNPEYIADPKLRLEFTEWQGKTEFEDGSTDGKDEGGVEVEDEAAIN